jgi:hypothetical protein
MDVREAKDQRMQAAEAGSRLESMEIEDLEPDEEASEQVAGGCATGKHIEADGTLVD